MQGKKWLKKLTIGVLGKWWQSFVGWNRLSSLIKFSKWKIGLYVKKTNIEDVRKGLVQKKNQKNDVFNPKMGIARL